MPSPLRTLLLATLIIGLVGTEVELLLLEHFEDVWQLVPVVLLGVAVLALLAHAFARNRFTVRTVQVTMLLFTLSGVLGTWLHYQSNAEFELEITPDLVFWPLFTAAMAGTMPVLAPGAMIQLGLIGLAWSFRHPVLQPQHPSSPISHPQ